MDVIGRIGFREINIATVRAEAAAADAARTSSSGSSYPGGEQIMKWAPSLAQIAERDERDMSRKDSPLYQAADAHLLDTTALSIEAAAQAAYAIVDHVLATRG